MSAKADVCPVLLDDSERLIGATRFHPITDVHEQLGPRDGETVAGQKERLSPYTENTPITVDPSKGLSKLQRQILGTAYTMHEYGARVHAGNIPDYVMSLGVFVNFRIAPSIPS